ncbi:MAG: glycosyltransferase [Sterolibacteriaceae bacterium]|nr:glycosyltransferase [Candidatus Methylophosphatis haderslevensis]
MTLRVLFITTGLGTGGAERMLVKLIDSLGRRDVECRVASLRDAGTQGIAIRSLGVAVDELRVNSITGFLMAPLRIARMMWIFRPDIVQGWMYHGNLLATFAGLMRPCKCRLFWSIRQTLYNLSSERWSTRQVVRAGAVFSRLPERLIYNSGLSAKQHTAAGYFGDRAVVVPNGFDLTRFRPDQEQRARKRAELGIAPGVPVVGVVARSHPMKDHATLVDAAVRVRQAFPDVLFVLAGSEIDASNVPLVSRIAARELDRNFMLLGEVTDTENVYPALDVCALSSSWGEAFPNVLGEAMACGVPCVSTDLGEARHIIDDTGATVPIRAPAALGAAISGILALDAAARRQLGARARQRVARLFSLDAVCEAYLDCYATKWGTPA